MAGNKQYLSNDRKQGVDVTVKGGEELIANEKTAFAGVESTPKPESAPLRFAQCPCCTSVRMKPFYINPAPSPIINWQQFFFGSRKFIHSIYRCCDCGYRFINNLTADAEKYYCQQEAGHYINKSIYRQRYFRELKNRLEKQRGFVPLSGFSMLDLGCADGEWLLLWQKNADLFGTEISPEFCTVLKKRGIKIVSPPFDRRFDVITMFDYLEHVPDPLAELHAMSRLLNKGGYLILSVPDMGKIIAKLLGIRYYLFCPMHFSYFDRQSLGKLLDRAYPQGEAVLFRSPAMKFDLKMLFNWLRISHLLPRSANLPMPIGYSASLVAMVRF